MARIPPKLEPAIREKAGEGLSAPQIAAWLRTEHGVVVSDRAINYRLEADREVRAAAAKDIVQTRLAKELPADLDALGAVQRRLTKIAAGLVNKDDEVPREDLRDYLAVTDRLTRVLDLKLHYSGADTPPPGESADPSQALVDKFAALVEREQQPAVH